jgi:hypothetical protein
LKEHQKASALSDADLVVAKTEAFEKGYAQGIREKNIEIDKLVNEYAKEQEHFKTILTQAQKEAFDDGRKSQKEYLTKKEKERIREEIAMERFKREIEEGALLMRIEKQSKDIGVEKAIYTSRALSVTTCALVLESCFWKKTADKKLPTFFREVAKRSDSLEPFEVDRMSRIALKYISNIGTNPKVTK